jgi:hypothetical protein
MNHYRNKKKQAAQKEDQSPRQAEENDHGNARRRKRFVRPTHGKILL